MGTEAWGTLMLTDCRVRSSSSGQCGRVSRVELQRQQELERVYVWAGEADVAERLGGRWG